MAGTGKDHGRLNLDIWGDDDFLDLSPQAQHLYLVLWFHPGLSYCGAGEWRPSRIAMKSRGWTGEHVMAAGAELAGAKGTFLVVDTDTEEYLLRSWIKHDGLWKTPNMAVSMANARAELASRTLRAVIVHEVAKIRSHEPESTSWKRNAVSKMLEQNAIDPTKLDPYNPWANPGFNPPSNPPSKGWQLVNPNPTSNPLVNPGPTPSPTPAPLTPSPSGGYERAEGYVGEAARNQIPPSKFCAQHPLGTDANCRPCGAARAAHAEFMADRVRTAQAAQSKEARDRAELRAEAIDECSLCDETGYVGTVLCDHDPESAERARRGMEQVRALFGKAAGE
jgi:hypothetical protein